MKKLIATAFCTMLLFCGMADANFTYQPAPPDLEDLPHAKFFGWQISSPLPTANIVSATIEINTLFNISPNPPQNELFINLMSKADIVSEWSFVPGNHVYVGDDPDTTVIHNDLPGTPLTSFIDPDNYQSIDYFSYNLNNDEINLLQGYIDNDGVFGVGFDPDCHFYNSGVKLILTAPTPGAFLLAGLGVGLVGWYRRRRIL